mgnify:CR=1 FL=1
MCETCPTELGIKLVGMCRIIIYLLIVIVFAGFIRGTTRRQQYRFISPVFYDGVIEYDYHIAL